MKHNNVIEDFVCWTTFSKYVFFIYNLPKEKQYLNFPHPLRAVQLHVYLFFPKKIFSTPWDIR